MGFFLVKLGALCDFVRLLFLLRKKIFHTKARRNTKGI